MGKKRRRVTSPKFVRKFATKFAKFKAALENTAITTAEVEKAISGKMAEATESVFLPYLACEIEPDEELTDEKIESHIAECMQKTHSWQPVQSYPN